VKGTKFLAPIVYKCFRHTGKHEKLQDLVSGNEPAEE